MSTIVSPPPIHHVPPAPELPDRETRLGIVLVAMAALTWSFGGPIARFLEATDPWTIVFWRSFWATAFLTGFMMVRDGPAGTIRSFAVMGWAGIGVAASFAIASMAFIQALQHTTVANILLMQTAVPLIAALLSFAMFKERTTAPTWFAIAAVCAGIAIMVSDSVTGLVSPVGDALALLITISYAFSTVLIRRHAAIRMTPAICLATLMAMTAGFFLSGSLEVSLHDHGLLLVFGALNLGLGMAFFATGARLLPAAIAALIALLEPIAGPVWTWLIHSEMPSQRTLTGGFIVVVVLLVHILWQMRQARPRAVTTPPSL